MDRRSFLISSLAAAGALGAGVSLAATGGERRLVVVVLRGGLDGLAAVPAVGDPGHLAARGGAAPADPLPLDGTFGLHPALAPIAPWFTEGALLPVHAVAVPYDDRSHFSAQDVLENGTTNRGGRRDGWLARALAARDGRLPAVGIGLEVPLLLRGPHGAISLDPTRTRRTSDRLVDVVAELYAADPLLGPALDGWREADALLERAAVSEARGTGPWAAARATGALLASDGGPRVAVLDVGGWDTHTNQAPRLARGLAQLAEGLVALREGLGAAWRTTAIAVVTEFGRTVGANGTGGTDHGVGGAALLAGGAVAGGRVLADWPGLGPGDLVDGRDLRPTTDLRAVFKGVLRDHLAVPARALDREVFPDSGPVRPLDGLLRA